MIAAQIDANSPPSKLVRSRYNYFVQRGDRWIGYNARIGSIAVLAQDVVELLRDNGELSDIRGVDELVQLGFLHYGDELDQIFKVYNDARDNTVLHLTIAPSLACNFACSYCYQNPYRNARLMSDSIRQATLRFIEARVIEGRRNVVLDWYGGEPLLAKQVVFEMTPAIRDVVVTAGGVLERVEIITNGSLLDLDTAVRLRAAGVGSAQVSFDALQYVEGQKRGVFDENGEASPILANLLTAKTHLELNLRINVSEQNKDEVPAIVDALESYGFGRNFYLARIDEFGNEDAQSPQSSTSPNELPVLQQVSPNGKRSPGRQELSRVKYAELERRVFGRPELVQWWVQKLHPKQHFCSATTGAMFVIDADGDISRCWESAGVKSQSIGNVLSECQSSDGEAIESKWKSYNPLAYSACAGCRVLPLCMGGCSYPRVILDAQNPECTAIRNQIQFCVDEVGKRLNIPAQV